MEKITVISSKKGNFLSPVFEVFSYIDLLYEYCKRELMAPYKQSILGPAWFFAIPFLSSVIYTFVFGNLAQISTDGTPKFLFYLSGTMCWALFAETFSKTSITFNENAALYSKIYFPRLIPVFSKLIVNIFRFAVQVMIFSFFWLYFKYVSNYDLSISLEIILIVPVVVLSVSIMALSFGLIMSTLTYKYKDLSLVLGLIVQIWMFLSPVVYPMSIIPDTYIWLAYFNPISPFIELFRWGLLGEGTIIPFQFVAAGLITFSAFLLGGFLFSRSERVFMDTV